MNFETVPTAAASDDEDASDEDPADTWLEACWNANEKMPLLLETAISGGIAGDVYLRLLEPEILGGFPEIVSLDPQFVTVSYDPHNYKKVIQWRVTWTGVNETDYKTPTPVTFRCLVTRADNGTWEITDQESVGNNAVFVTVEESVWPFDFCPIFHAKNSPSPNQFHGRSDLEDDVLNLNDAINFILSNVNRILRAHGHPTTYATGVGPGEIDRGIGEVMFLPPGAELHNVEMISDLASSHEHLKSLMEAYHELTSIPEVASGKLETVGQLSGLAIQILYNPLVAAVTVKRMFYGTMLQKVCLALLEMGGMGEGVKDVTIQWPSILPSDPAGDVTTAIAKQSVGVSQDTLLTELGYDPKNEADKSAAEAKTAGQNALTMLDRGTGTGQGANDE